IAHQMAPLSAMSTTVTSDPIVAAGAIAPMAPSTIAIFLFTDFSCFVGSRYGSGSRKARPSVAACSVQLVPSQYRCWWRDVGSVFQPGFVSCGAPTAAGGLSHHRGAVGSAVGRVESADDACRSSAAGALVGAVRAMAAA